jgi:hypothetical protein
MDAVMNTDALSSTIKENEKPKRTSQKPTMCLKPSFFTPLHKNNNNDDAVAEQRLNDAVNTNGIWVAIKSVAKKSS